MFVYSGRPRRGAPTWATAIYKRGHRSFTIVGHIVKLPSRHRRDTAK